MSAVGGSGSTWKSYDIVYAAQHSIAYTTCALVRRGPDDWRRNGPEDRKKIKGPFPNSPTAAVCWNVCWLNVRPTEMILCTNCNSKILRDVNQRVESRWTVKSFHGENVWKYPIIMLLIVGANKIEDLCLVQEWRTTSLYIISNIRARDSSFSDITIYKRSVFFVRS